MSKMDNLRAMREARYEQAAARSPKAAAQQTATPGATTAAARTATRVAVPAPPASTPTEPAPTAEPAAQPEAALCGHRAISGRTCTREAGHTAKSHRYARPATAPLPYRAGLVAILFSRSQTPTVNDAARGRAVPRRGRPRAAAGETGS
jgi:hypothetical protein